MKKRDLFWISRLGIFFAIILLFSVMIFVNMLQFNSSYIREEKEELNVFRKQIQWAAVPYLRNRNYSGLKEYAADFEGEDVKFRIFAADGNLLASSNPSDTSPMVKKDSRVLKKRSQWNVYRHSIKDKEIRSVGKFEAGNSEYYIEMTLLEEAVIGRIIAAQRNLFILFSICSGIILLAVFQTFYQVRSRFNEFDDSVLKIANGDLDTNLKIPKLKILEELALSVKKMTQRLKRQIERLRQLEAYKDEFIQNVSHEIKTPITAINMALELMQSSDNKEQNKECLEIIQYQIKAINKLVNDILMLSGITEAKTKDIKQFARVDINDLAAKVVNSFNTGDIKINFNSTDKEIMTEANGELLQSAIQNLITNAIRYSGTDRIDVTVSKTDDYISISVKDYGIGIEEEYQDKIFDKFYRIDKARSRQKGGTGLGLAIVRDIAGLHDGQISLRSQKGSGSEFTLTLPACRK